MMPIPKPLSAMLDQATPYGVLLGNGMTELELVQERHEEAMGRDRIRRAESRSRRRYIAGQPKPIVTLDRVVPPGAPYELFGTFVGGTLPEEWVGSEAAIRELVRRS